MTYKKSVASRKKQKILEEKYNIKAFFLIQIKLVIVKQGTPNFKDWVF